MDILIRLLCHILFTYFQKLGKFTIFFYICNICKVLNNFKSNFYFIFSAVARTLTARQIAVVGVGFPATPLMEGRIRYCLSASHTKEQLEYACNTIDEISETLGLKYSRKIRETGIIEY